MAESDNAVRLVTGRQSAHMEIIRRHPNGKASDEDRRKPREMPEVSVVEWETHEEVCKPYRIKALVSTSEPVSRKDILGQWVKFRFQTEEGAPVRAFFGFVSRFHSVSRSPDGCTYRVVIRQRLALADGPSNCATYQNKSSPEIIDEVIGRNDLKPWTRVVTRCGGNIRSMRSASSTTWAIGITSAWKWSRRVCSPLRRTTSTAKCW